MLIDLSVEMIFKSAPTQNTDDQFEAFLDEVLAQFDRIGREVNLAARIGDRSAEFAVTVDAENFDNAFNGFMPDLRTALHAAGCVTAGWPRFEPQTTVVRDLQRV